MANFYLGVIADTHGDVKTTSRAFDLFAAWNVERVIHCGDVGAPIILEVFRRIPTDFVLGNCDGRYQKELEAGIPAVGGRLFGAAGSLEWRGKRIFWTHGNDLNRVDNETFSEEWDLICLGHTHRFEERRYKNTLVLNPGAVLEDELFPSVEPPSCCVVDSELRVERLTISRLPFYSNRR